MKSSNATPLNTGYISLHQTRRGSNLHMAPGQGRIRSVPYCQWLERY
jgi:hypothetical protein